ncbi:MAG: hypothetical protein A4E57_02292 [Syntrophorhabdaceae bacterium PtaU1.Bin034]|jgi:hypothetical protein|nr:MAG: hypothetical protein A4E57_02292 [Syntrophorhabdaceae bacterium PtaU1.Bin034]
MNSRGEKDICELPEPGDMVAYRAEGAYEKLHLCHYLRELPENPITEVEDTVKE